MVSSEPLLLPVSLEGEFSTSMKEMIGGCCVCSDERGWAENPLVYCDGHGCNVAVHQGEWAGGPRSPPGVPVPWARVRVPIGPSWHPQSRFPACRPACSPIWAGLSSPASRLFPHVRLPMLWLPVFWLVEMRNGPSRFSSLLPPLGPRSACACQSFAPC